MSYPPGRSRRSFRSPSRRSAYTSRVLKKAGLLAERKDGTRRLYSLRHEALDPVRSLLAEFWPDALARLKTAVERAHQPNETRQS